MNRMIKRVWRPVAAVMSLLVLLAGVSAPAQAAIDLTGCSFVYVNDPKNPGPFSTWKTASDGYWSTGLLKVAYSNRCNNIYFRYNALRCNINGHIIETSPSNADTAVKVRMTNSSGTTLDWGDTVHVYEFGTWTKVVTNVINGTWYEFRLQVHAANGEPYTTEDCRPKFVLAH